MSRKTKLGWKHEVLTHQDYAEVVSRRLCVNLDVAELALKNLDFDPWVAFSKMCDMEDEGAIEYILNCSAQRVK